MHKELTSLEELAINAYLLHSLNINEVLRNAKSCKVLQGVKEEQILKHIQKIEGIK